MRRFWPLALVSVALLVMGCGASLQQISAEELARRATASPLVAQRDLAGRRVLVEGIVRGATISQRESVVGQEAMGTMTAEKHRETLALVVLEPGAVLCYFEPEDLGQAADLKANDRVRLECKVDSFRHSETGIEAVLAGCERKSP